MLNTRSIVSAWLAALTAIACPAPDGRAAPPHGPECTESAHPALRGVHFAPNLGQWADESVRFGFKSRGVHIAFRESLLTMHLSRPVEQRPSPSQALLYRLWPGLERLAHAASQWQRADPHPRSALMQHRNTEPQQWDSHIITVSFPGANPVEPRGQLPSSLRLNYYIGDDQSRWATDVPTFAAIVYEHIYDGIDLHVMAAPDGRGVLKYEFHCAPGADYTQIRIRYHGIKALRVSEATGDLLIKTPLGTLRDSAPLVWQEDGGASVPLALPPQTLPARFEIIDRCTYTITIQTTPDSSRPLVIDPELEWMYYLGGTGTDGSSNLILDSTGNILLTGRTTSADFLGQINSYSGGGDAYILKVSPSGQPLWMTYLGGSGDEADANIAVDSADSLLVSGTTSSTNFPGRTNSYHGGVYDGFILKVSPTGQLLWMTYLGGSAEDWASGLAVDSTGDALVSGYTFSDNFAGRTNSYYGNTDAFLLRVNPSGQLQWMTYYGGSAWDWAGRIALSPTGDALLAGWTRSTDFAGQNNAYMGGGQDAFLLRVNPSGAIQWMTYLGGTGSDDGGGIAVRDNDDVLVVGSTYSVDFAGRINSHRTFPDAYVLMVSPTGQLQWMAYLGGHHWDFASKVVMHDHDHALVSGTTASTDFEGRINSHYGGTFPNIRDAFALMVDMSGQVQWMMYFGGNHDEFAYGLAVDDRGDALLSGITSSTNFQGRNNAYLGGPFDAFLLKIRLGACYANCDNSTQPPILNIADFSCFLQKFAAGDSYANCDGSTQEPVLNVADFSCFLGMFAAGCN
jgi:hypothetical protein